MKARKTMMLLLGAELVLSSVLGGAVFAQEQNNAKDYQGPANSTGQEISLKDQGTEDSAATDAPVVSYSSLKLTGSLISGTRTSFWAGETVCGNNTTNVLYGPATLDRVYGMSGLIYANYMGFNGGSFSGPSGFSYCFPLPINRAEGGSIGTFAFRTYVEDTHKAIRAQLPFTVKRPVYVNSTRAYVPTMNPSLQALILSSITAVKNALVNSVPRYTPSYQQSVSLNACAFLRNLNVYKPTAALIHSHGNNADGGRIYFPDDSYVHANASGQLEAGKNGYPVSCLPSLLPPMPVLPVKVGGGLFYAGICDGADYPELGQAFVNSGYTGFISYAATVYTDRNAQFYVTFFLEAVKPNVSVATALLNTVAWANGQGWSDVATAKCSGDCANLYLGGKYDTPPTTFPAPPALSANESSVMPEQPVVALARHWTNIKEIQLNAAEQAAVDKALAVKTVKDAMTQGKPLDGASSDAVIGLEEFRDVYRVSVKANGRYIQGVDISKDTGEVIAQGAMD